MRHLLVTRLLPAPRPSESVQQDGTGINSWRQGFSESIFVRLPAFAILCHVFQILPVRRLLHFSAAFFHLLTFANSIDVMSLGTSLAAVVA